MTAAERLLGSVRVLHAWVRRDGQWYGPVLVEQYLDGEREGYVYDPKSGTWYAPARWKPWRPAA